MQPGPTPLALQISIATILLAMAIPGSVEALKAAFNGKLVFIGRTGDWINPWIALFLYGVLALIGLTLFIGVIRRIARRR